MKLISFDFLKQEDQMDLLDYRQNYMMYRKINKMPTSIPHSCQPPALLWGRGWVNWGGGGGGGKRVNNFFNIKQGS